MSWSSWKNMRTPTDYGDHCVYKVRLLSGGKVMPLDRFLGSDPKGILAFGMASSMEHRRRDFVAGISNSKRSAEANLLHAIEVYSFFNQRFRHCSYEYSFQKTPNRYEARTEYIRLMKAYAKRFGEVPPLNSTLPDKLDNRSW